jgi:hypothetical protein
MRERRRRVRRNEWRRESGVMPHTSPGDASSTSANASEKRFQYACSSDMRRRPAAVIFRFAPILGLAPFRGNEPLVPESIECLVKRALLDAQLVAGDLLNSEEDTVAVKRPSDTALRMSKSSVPCSSSVVVTALSWIGQESARLS